jgi:hypothetical protein
MSFGVGTLVTYAQKSLSEQKRYGYASRALSSGSKSKQLDLLITNPLANRQPPFS